MKPDDLSATRSFKTVGRLVPIDEREDIPKSWIGTPLDEFISSQNFGRDIAAKADPQLLIVSCIEFRFNPRIPSGFSYVIRSAGGRLSNIDGSEFALSYILAKGVRHFALVGHNDCGMTKVFESKPMLVDALVEQEWSRADAEQLVETQAPEFAIKDEIDSLEHEYLELSRKFPKITIAPLFVSLSSERLHYPLWYKQLEAAKG